MPDEKIKAIHMYCVQQEQKNDKTINAMSKAGVDIKNPAYQSLAGQTSGLFAVRSFIEVNYPKEIK